MKVLIIVGGGLLTLLVLGWVGLHIPPNSLVPFPQQTVVLQRMPLPRGLPRAR